MFLIFEGLLKNQKANLAEMNFVSFEIKTMQILLFGVI